jgi:hypothetical protein
VSAIATFTKLPIALLDGLLEATATMRPLADYPEHLVTGYCDYLEGYGREVVDFQWSGYIIVTLLQYLDDRHGISFRAPEHEAFVRKLADLHDGRRPWVLTLADRTAHLATLDGPFSMVELRDYWREFNASDEDLGQAMLDGIRAIRDALVSLDERSVVLLDVVF